MSSLVDAKANLKSVDTLFEEVEELELTPEFFESKHEEDSESEEEDTCPQLEENPFEQTKLIKISDNINHKQLKCMKVAAIEGLKKSNSSITSLVDNYRFIDKRGNQSKLDLTN